MLQKPHIFIALLSSGFITQALHAFVTPDRKISKHALNLSSRLPIEAKVLRLKTQKAHPDSLNKRGDASEIYTDELSKAVRLLAGHLNVAAISDDDLLNTNAYIKVAKDYIDQNPQVFGVNSSDIELVSPAILLTEEDQFFKFAVLRDGLRIEDATIDFRFKYGKLVQVVNQSFAEAKVAAHNKNLKDLNEKALALTGLKKEQLTRLADTYRVQANHSLRTYELIKVANFTVDAEESNYALQIESTSGKLFELKDQHYHLAGKAKLDVYPRWFNEDLQEEPLSFVKINTRQSSVSSNKNGEFEAQEGSNPQINNGLKGMNVDVRVMTGTSIKREAGQVRNEWEIYVERRDNGSPWLDKDTAQSMIYYHTSAIVEDAKRFISSPWLNTPLIANANLNATCNAHWDGRTINLYSGDSNCANTGLIADVIYHEWGHGLDANTGGIEDGAFSEGFGDIMSLIMTRSNLLGIGFRLPNHEPVRDLEPDMIYPRDRGEVHFEGLIIASTFWDLYKALKDKHGDDASVELLKKYAYKMIYTARTYLDVYPALLVIDDNDDDLTNGSPNKCIINKAFSEHGLTPRDASCILASIDHYGLNDSDGDKIIEPGETIQISATARNMTQSVVSGLRGSFNIVSGSGVQFNQDTLTWDDIAPRQALVSRDNAVLEISENASCGSSFTARLTLTSGDREITTDKTFLIGKNTGSATAYSAQGLPVQIRDNQTVSAKTSVYGDDWQADTTIANIRLKFAISHTYVGDLTIHLISPEGNRVEIFKGQGNGQDVNFDEDISHLFAGKLGKGDWTLSITDSASRDEGRLNSFVLTVTPANYQCD